jgi:hypothetical protein
VRQVGGGREVGRREVGRGVRQEGKSLGQGKRAEKTLGKGRGCVLGSSSKWLEQPHPELVHWWLLVHSSPFRLAPGASFLFI